MNKDKRYIEIFRAALEEYPCSGGAEASIGFFYGALWADKHPNLASLWHDESEEPKGAFLPTIPRFDKAKCYPSMAKGYVSLGEQTAIIFHL